MGKTQAQGRQAGRGGGHGGPMMHAPERAKEFKKTLKRLWHYLSSEKYKFIFVGILAVLSSSFSIAGPKIMGMATTSIANSFILKAKGGHGAIDFSFIGHILLSMLALYAVSALFSFIMGFLMSSVSQRTVYKLRVEVKQKLDKLPLKYYDTTTNGEILSRITNDMDNIANTLQQSLTQLINSVVTILGVIIMMIVISPVMTLIALFTLPANIILTLFSAKKSQKYFKEQQKLLGELNGHVEEMYAGHRIVKAFSQEAASIERFTEINNKLYGASWKAQFISGILMPVLTFVNNISYVLVCVAGGFFAARRTIQIGDIQSFIQYMRQFTHPIIQTANIANIIQSTIASCERVFELLDEEEQPDEFSQPVVIKDPKGNVSFKDVSFGYTKDNTLIENMDIDVLSGQTIAIVGPTGAGKTTVVNLLLRFYELNKGKITIDGKDITHLKRKDLHELFGMVLQDTWLFSGTILENIAYARENAGYDEVVAAARAAYAEHFIMTLPNGFETELNEDASNISQGQKQLLTIARAILYNPSILILDEATSSVDTRTEQLIQKAMGNLMKGRTSFVIAHRLGTIKNADLILVMKKGSIIEKGTHKELLESGGFYADMYNSQFVNANAVL